MLLRHRRRKKRSRLASFGGEKKISGNDNDARPEESVEICDEFEDIEKDGVHEIHGVTVPVRVTELPASLGTRPQELPA